MRIESLLRQDMLERPAPIIRLQLICAICHYCLKAVSVTLQWKRKSQSGSRICSRRYGDRNRDLQQCADAVIRLRAEYLWKHKRYADIKFNFTSGFTAEYKKWAEGNRIKVNDNQVQWYASGKGVDYSYKTFRNYLDMVFMYAGTASLSRELPAVLYTSLQPGDVFIKGGSPGHAVIVMMLPFIRIPGRKYFSWHKAICLPNRFISWSIQPAATFLPGTS